MKAVIIALLCVVAVVSAQTVKGFCMDVTVNDVTCEGHRSKFPTKACSFVEGQNVSTSTACDSGLAGWKLLCPVKNVDNSSFCEGTGYTSAYNVNEIPCGTLLSCTQNSDCEFTIPPVSPQAPVFYCYDCCTFCFEGETCDNLVASNTTFTNSTQCTECKPAEPVAAPASGNPTTPGTSNIPKSNTGAIVVVSGIILAFSALLF